MWDCTAGTRIIAFSPPRRLPPSADSFLTTAEGPATASGRPETDWSSASSTTPRLSLQHCQQPEGGVWGVCRVWGIFEALSATVSQGGGSPSMTPCSSHPRSLNSACNSEYLCLAGAFSGSCAAGLTQCWWTRPASAVRWQCCSLWCTGHQRWGEIRGKGRGGGGNGSKGAGRRLPLQLVGYPRQRLPGKLSAYIYIDPAPILHRSW